MTLELILTEKRKRLFWLENTDRGEVYAAYIRI